MTPARTSLLPTVAEQTDRVTWERSDLQSWGDKDVFVLHVAQMWILQKADWSLLARGGLPHNLQEDESSGTRERSQR